MSTAVSLNGVSYNIPATGDDAWGDEVSNYLIALSTGVLTKAGGSFTLTAEIDLGATYGIKAPYIKSRTANPAAAGVLRFANNEGLSWRNAANSADKALKVNASNVLEYDGAPIVTLALGAANTALRMNSGGTAYEWAALVDANIAAAAAIAVSKLAATTVSRAIVSDASGFITASAATATEVGYLSGVTSAIQTQIAAKQALDATLTAFAAYNTNGILTQTAADTFVGRTLTAGSTKLAVTNGNGVAGNPTVDVTEASLSLENIGGLLGSAQLTANLSGKTLTTAILNSPAITTPTGIVKGDVGLGNVDNTSDATRNAAAVVLTNKDFDGGTASNTSRITVPKAAKATLDALTRKEGTLVYASDLDTLYADNGTTLSPVGAGSSGELNLIDNPNDAYASWSETGTVFNSSPVTTSTAGDLPLSGIIETAIKMTSSTAAGTEATDYVSHSFTTPASLAAKLKVEFYMRPGTNFVASEWTVSIYAGATRQSLSTDASSVTYLPNASGKFTTTFDCAASTAYTLRFARPVNAGVNAGVLNVANVIVGPGIQPQGSVVGPWLSFTPVLSGATGGTATGNYRQVGDSMEVNFLVSGATWAAGNKALTIPASLTVDTTKIPTVGAETIVYGSAQAYDTSAATRYAGVVVHSTTTSVRFAGPSTADVWSAAIPFAFTNGSDQIGGRFTVPIAEWAGSGTVNLAQNDVEYASCSGTWDAPSTTTVFGQSGALMGGALTDRRAKTITWQTPIMAGDVIQVWGSQNGTNWTPIIGSQLGPTNVTVSTGLMSTSGTELGGVSWRSDSTTQTLVEFKQYINFANDDAPVVNWPSSAAYWLATKSRAGQAVGFGAATATASGLVSREESGSFSAAVSGPSAGTITIYYSRVGKSVALTISNFSGTSTSTTFGTISLANMPASLRPVIQSDYIVRVFLAATDVVGFFRLPTSGNITIYRDVTSASFTSGSAWGWPQALTVSYVSP